MDYQERSEYTRLVAADVAQGKHVAELLVKVKRLEQQLKWAGNRITELEEDLENERAWGFEMRDRL